MENIEQKLAVVTNYKRPAIIKGFGKKSGDKLLANHLWERLYLSWIIYRDIDKLSNLALWFKGRHPQKESTCIIPVLIHFELLMGLNVMTDTEYNKTLDTLIPHDATIDL